MGALYLVDTSLKGRGGLMPQPVQDGSMNISIMGALYLVVPNNLQRRELLGHSVKPPRPFSADGVEAKIQVSK